MTCGIYALYWEVQDKIYIGLSQDIESRWKEHITSMQNRSHTNYLVQKAFIEYGLPQKYILQECGIEELNDLEIYWTHEFNALDRSVGLCLVEPGKVGWGTNSNASKYSRRIILKVFSLLYKSELSIIKIASRLKVPKSLVNDILIGKTHIWLKAAYPEQYADMLLRGRVDLSIASKLGFAPAVRSPQGEIFQIGSITEFCKSLDIPGVTLTTKVRGLARVIDGTRSQYRGWKLV